MNIMINDYCNLKCSYCFAQDSMIVPKKNNMTMENFNKVLSFYKKNNIRDVRLIGGEPTMHPQFIDFLMSIANDNYFSSIHIFSNMTFNERVLNTIKLISKSKRITILPNCNQAAMIGEDNYQKLISNIRELCHCNNKIITAVGINIHKPDMDYSYINDIANKFNIPKIRWSITTPNYQLSRDFNIKAYFKSFIPVLQSFIADSVKYKKILGQDCNTFPVCLLDDDVYRELTMASSNLCNKNTCNLVLDINHNLDVIRCFGMSEDFSINLETVPNMQDLVDKMKKQFNYLHNKPLFKECLTCSSYQKLCKTCACLRYKK